jgi:hypothetical protein
MRVTAIIALFVFIIGTAPFVGALAISRANTPDGASSRINARFIQVARGELKCYRDCMNNIAGGGGTLDDRRNFCAGQCGLRKYL